MLVRLKRKTACLLQVVPGGARLLRGLRQIRRTLKLCLRAAVVLCRTGSQSEVDLHLGHALLQEGQLEGAVERFTRAVRRARGLARAYLARGLALHQVGRAEEACRDFQAALAVGTGTATETAMLHENLASVLAERHEIDQ